MLFGVSSIHSIISLHEQMATCDIISNVHDCRPYMHAVKCYFLKVALKIQFIILLCLNVDVALTGNVLSCSMW